MTPLFGKPLAVVNVGLAAFGENVASAGAPVARVQWSPPAAPGGAPLLSYAVAVYVARSCISCEASRARRPA